jgi:hypothetical protein
LSFQFVHNNKTSNASQEKQHTSFASSKHFSDKELPIHTYFSSSFLHPIHGLQQTVGNQAVQKLVRSDIIQAKLKVSHPNDVYEQEADRVAEQVMRMSVNAEDIASLTTIDDERIFDRKCQTCQDEDDKEMIHRRTTDKSEYGISHDIAKHSDNILCGGGSPLDKSTKQFMESRLDHDFSKVKYTLTNKL